MVHADFNQRALCPSGHDRPGRAPERRLHSLKGSGPAAGDLGKISGEHHQAVGKGQPAQRRAGQGGRLSPDPHPGQLYRGQRPAADRGLTGSCFLPGTRSPGVQPVVRVPYPVHVAGAGQDHQRLSGQHHHRRSDPNRLPGRFLRHRTTRTKNKVRKQNIRLRTLFFSASTELFCPWTGHRGSCS